MNGHSGRIKQLAVDVANEKRLEYRRGFLAGLEAAAKYVAHQLAGGDEVADEIRGLVEPAPAVTNEAEYLAWSSRLAQYHQKK